MIAFLQRIRNLFQNKWIQSKDNPYLRYERMDAVEYKPISIEQLIKCMPGISYGRADQHLQPINDTMERYLINTPLRQAHFLAQVSHESASLRYMEEIADGSAYENRIDLGNTEPGDGKRFKGRGVIQTTGRANYRLCGIELGIDLLAHPELLATEPYASLSAGWFWNRNSLNVIADTDNLKMITRRVNGGLTNLADREQRLEKCKQSLGIS